MRVRQAIAHAINVDDIIEVAYKNTAVPENSPLSPKISGYPNGFKTYIWINDNTIRKDIATILQDQFKTIGIDATADWWNLAKLLNPDYDGGHGDIQETSTVMAIDRDSVNLEYFQI